MVPVKIYLKSFVKTFSCQNKFLLNNKCYLASCNGCTFCLQEVVFQKRANEKLGISIRGGSKGSKGNPLDADDEGIFISKVSIFYLLSIVVGFSVCVAYPPTQLTSTNTHTDHKWWCYRARRSSQSGLPDFGGEWGLTVGCIPH